MGKPRQQVLSRFFAPEPRSPNAATADFKPPPIVSTTVSFSPSASASKRARTKPPPTPSPPSKKPKAPNANSDDAASSSPSSSIHKSFVRKLLESSPSPTALPRRQNPVYTPLELQVVELKAKNPDVLLMVEVGYRYRFFGEDAAIASKVLGIFAHNDHNFLTASIPTFRIGFHVRRLVKEGYKVGVVRQTETAAIKAQGENKLGPFSRGLSALYTKATVEAAADMQGGEHGQEIGGSSSNYLLCVVDRGLAVGNGERGKEEDFDVKIGIIAVEVSTGEVIYGEFKDNAIRSSLEAVVFNLSPAEILLGEPLSSLTEKMLLEFAGPTSNIRVQRVSSYCFDDGGALTEVISLYDNLSSDYLSPELEAKEFISWKEENHRLGLEVLMTMPELSVIALAMALRYLKQFSFERMICWGVSFRPLSSNFEMTLSANTLNQLEVLKNNFNGSLEGSLLQVMDHTFSPFGSRLLKHWVSHPLLDRNSITARLDAVSEIARSIGSARASSEAYDLDGELTPDVPAQPGVGLILSSVLSMLGKSPDIQRGLTRIFHRTANPNEFVGILHAFLVAGKQLQKLEVEKEDKEGTLVGNTVKSALLRRLVRTASSSSIIAHSAKLLSYLNMEAAMKGDMLATFNVSSNQFPEVAAGRAALHSASQKLDLLIVKYRNQLGLQSLEFTSVSGTTHLIELPPDSRVPSNWIRVSSTKKAIRYHPPEVLKGLDDFTVAKEQLIIICKVCWERFVTGFARYYAQFEAAVQALAALDCLYSLAVLSKNKDYVRPVFVHDEEASQIHILSGRHPVMESVLGDNFVPNDTSMRTDGENCQIVTGPNMGGKSCYIRQVALIVLMAQVGSFVPASSAKLRVMDGIYTRMGASDSIQQGRSTFYEELSEVSHILRSCSPYSLVIIDELGRGTSTHDGVAIAYATLHFLLKQKGCIVLFVTHYPKILDIKEEFNESVAAYHVSYLTSKKGSEISETEKESGVRDLDCVDVTFLYKLVRGASDKCFGLNVARVAQLPSSCVSRASVMAAKMETELRTRIASCSQISEKEMQPERLPFEDISMIKCESKMKSDNYYQELVRVLSFVLSEFEIVFQDLEEEHIFSRLRSAKSIASSMF